MNIQLDTITVSDSLVYLQSLPDNFVNCIITSPPYWGLRDYGVSGQMGLELTLKQFIDQMVELFREARRVLRDDGTLWINMGDSYSNEGKTKGKSSGKHAYMGDNVQSPRMTKRSAGLKPKDLVGQPWRLALALQDDGWYLRQDIIWSKVNPMPESTKDRFTKSHEYIFLLTKRPKYYFDWFAVREPATGTDNRPPAGSAEWDGSKPQSRTRNRGNGKTFRHGGRFTGNGSFDNDAEVPRPPSTQDGVPNITRNRRSVWTIPIQPSPIKHYATFPEALIEPMIKSGCPEMVCSKCKKPYVREVDSSGGTIGRSWHDHSDDLGRGMSQRKHLPNDAKYADCGLHPQCKCGAGTDAGIVLDMFMGSGTTALVARRLGRHYLGCDLNPQYVADAERRLKQTDPFQDHEIAEGLVQPSLFAV